MRRDELFIKPVKPQKVDRILFSLQGALHFEDECFVIADGVASLPHAKEAAKLAAETAIWAYKLVRQRSWYWDEKPWLLKRIFRSTNLTLWQKQREPGYGSGFASALTVLMVIDNYFWLGTAGNCNAFLYRDGLIEILAKRDVDEEGLITKAAGFSRAQLIPAKHSERLLEQDMIFLASDSIVNFISEDELRSVMEEVGDTSDTLDRATLKLVTLARTHGGHEPFSACLVKRSVI